MDNKTEYFSLIKTRLYLVLIIFSFLGPLLLATIMYKYSDVVPIAPPKSYGKLIEPVITINNENDFDNILNRKKWTFMYVYENEICDLLCEATLYVMQQVRESLGRERSRVSSVIVTNDNFENEQNKKIIKKYNKIRFINVINSSFFKNLEKNHLYIIDPLGNILIFYEKDFSAEGLKKDIKKLLKVSRIG